MSLLAAKKLPHRWDKYLERPFWRLVQLFGERIFRGGGDSDSEGLDLGIGLVLTMLAMPGGFVALLLLNKYGSLLQWMRGQKNVDTLMIALPDEYFFIVLSMVVTGAVAIWRWDAIFPDRRDFGNLVHLPISTRTIFSANLAAVLFLVALVAFDVNAASCVLFPAVVTAAQTEFLFFVKFAAVHFIGAVLASIFSFFAVFSVLGALMAVLPASAFKRISAYVRGLIVVYLVSLLCTSAAVPDKIWRIRDHTPAWMFFLPSTWFLALCQSLRARSNPALMQLERLILPGFLVVVAVALGTYAIGYRRHFMRIAEMSETTAGTRNPRPSRFGNALRQLLLRTPFQRGCFSFVAKTLLRSETHRLVLAAFAGLALVLASQAMMIALEGAKSARAAALSADALSVPFILTFLSIVGMRLVFEIPVELRANWIFQLTLDRQRQECEPLARRVILITVLPWAAGVTFAVYFYFAGIVAASLHALLVLTWSVLLTNLLLIRFRKLPFTCSFPVFKQHSIVILIAFCFGFRIYAVSTPDFEASALLNPIRLLSLLPPALVAWYIPRHFAGNTIEVERKMIFEETGPRSFEMLHLGE